MFLVNANLLQAVVNYLVRQPYGEVAEMLQALQQSEPAEAPELAATLPQQRDGADDTTPIGLVPTLVPDLEEDEEGA